jgi:cysteinyl-tRNA synthetase
VHEIEYAFRSGLEKRAPKETTNALLALDQTIWQAQQNLESEEFVSQARDTLRELIVSLGANLESSPMDKAECVAPLVEEMAKLRNEFRQQKKWKVADAIRDGLQRAGILLEDTKEGTRWRV